MFFTPKRLRLYLGALLLLQITSCIPQLPYIRTGYFDFRTFYTAGAMIRTGHAALLYSLPAELHFQSALVSPQSAALPMLAPPFAALPFVPLSLLRFWPAYAAFGCLNIALLCLAAALMRSQLRTLTARWRPAPFVLFLSFFPACVALIMGQLSILLLFLYCLAYLALRHRHNFLAGALLALALIKFQIALPVALLFLLWRQWEFSAGFFSAGAALAAVSAGIIGSQQAWAYLRSLYTLSHSITASHATQVSVGIVPRMMPTLFGIFFMLSGGGRWATAATVCASILLLLWAARRPPSLPFAVTVALLVSYHLYLYGATLLLLPVSLLADRFLEREAVPSTSPPASALPGVPPRLALQISTLALATLLLGPLEAFIYQIDREFLLVIPILALALFQTEWPSLAADPIEATSPHPQVHAHT